jgi:hypothetical protein
MSIELKSVCKLRLPMSSTVKREKEIGEKAWEL